MTRHDRASDYLEARLEQRRLSRLRRAGRFAAGVVGALLAGDSAIAGPVADLVVTRRETGGEVLRTEAGPPEVAEQLLRTVRTDLEQKSIAEFVQEWHLFE
ncbi:hypothetical protein [Salinibacterium sp. PAMC 21357]|uniref:hypothetical protein n=1 Tax=Salinibacterium sp. PAMC 21357 TaxID=1112215 RepID=UPI000289A4AD|nr:hypothetical protein [Salinibacterium sp. PAMC 21357]